jgi:hypothetical protein
MRHSPITEDSVHTNIFTTNTGEWQNCKCLTPERIIARRDRIVLKNAFVKGWISLFVSLLPTMIGLSVVNRSPAQSVAPPLLQRKRQSNATFSGRYT